VTTRPLKPSDIPILQEFARQSSFPYPQLDHPHIESVLVVVDSDDRPIMACAAKRLVELYLFVDPSRASGVKKNAIDALHHGMATALRGKLYNSAEIYLSPLIANAFGRRLERTWNWVRNWPSWHHGL
jgi:hypothetical protein